MPGQFSENQHPRDGGGRFATKTHLDADCPELEGADVFGQSLADEQREIDWFSDPSRTAAEIDDAISHPSRFVRHAAAENLSTTPIQLARLAKDPEPLIREAVARNVNTPHQVLSDLAEEDDETIRVGVAGNPSTDGSTLRRIHNPNPRGDMAAQTALAKNPSTPSDVVMACLESKNEGIRVAALSSPHIQSRHLDEVMQTGSEAERVAAIRSPATTRDHVLAGLRDPSVKVKLAAAGAPLATPDDVRPLMRDSSSRVRSAAYGKAHLGSQDVETGVNDSSANVVLVVATRADALTPSQCRKAVLSRDDVAVVVMRRRDYPAEDLAWWARQGRSGGGLPHIARSVMLERFGQTENIPQPPPF
jgi:hypothetical protein